MIAAMIAVWWPLQIFSALLHDLVEDHSVATDTFRLSNPPFMGMLIFSSHIFSKAG
jgi:hypothetical protein